MKPSEKIFENLFDDVRITSPRLLLFAQDGVNRFRKNDTANRFAPEITNMDTAQLALQKELGEVSGALATQKGTTFTVDGVLTLFKDTMKEKHTEIAYLLGGEKTAAYIEFYPGGKTEYGKTTKTQMPVLTKRVADMATKHTARLGVTLTAALQGFVAQWKNARNTQQGQKGSVGDNRSERSDARVALELGLTAAVHAVGRAFPGDVAQCVAYFNFALLDAPKNPSLNKPKQP